MDDHHGSKLVESVATVVALLSTRLGRPLRLTEVHQIAVAIAEGVGRQVLDREKRDAITPAATTAMLAETLRKGEPTDEAPILKQKRALSNTRGAIDSRAYRRRVKDRAARRVEVVPVEVGERHIDALERRGHYNAHLDRIDPGKAISAAVEDLLEALAPSKKTH